MPENSRKVLTMWWHDFGEAIILLLCFTVTYGVFGIIGTMLIYHNPKMAEEFTLGRDEDISTLFSLGPALIVAYGVALVFSLIPEQQKVTAPN